MADPAQGVLQRSVENDAIQKTGRRRWRPQWTARMALIPAMTITIVCFYGFIIWTFVGNFLSFLENGMLKILNKLNVFGSLSSVYH